MSEGGCRNHRSLACYWRHLVGYTPVRWTNRVSSPGLVVLVVGYPRTPRHRLSRLSMIRQGPKVQSCSIFRLRLSNQPKSVSGWSIKRGNTQSVLVFARFVLPITMEQTLAPCTKSSCLYFFGGRQGRRGRIHVTTRLELKRGFACAALGRG